MIGPDVNSVINNTNTISRELDSRVQQAPEANVNEDAGWFLPGNDGSLTTINVSTNSDLAGATPDAMASQILSHIGA